MRAVIYIAASLALLLSPVQFVSARSRPPAPAPEADDFSTAALIREINLARENPGLYAEFVAESRPLHMVEHGRAVDEAIRFLHKARPLSPLSLSSGMSRAAADHCAEQVNGQTGHDSQDGGSPGDRISRYGTWGIAYGENISYGQRTARNIVVALIIDDGIRSRGHRKNLFNPKFTVAGAAYGPHARYGRVCTTDFAGSYAERSGELVARNSNF
jgi:uncharacterized protein YkwD